MLTNYFSLLAQSVEADGSVLSIVKLNPQCSVYEGHFPGNPVVPGVILCEIMAQSCTITMLDALVDNLAVYRGIDDVKFKNTVRPGDLCEITCRVEEKKANLIRCTAKLEVGDKLCCRGTLTFALIPNKDL